MLPQVESKATFTNGLTLECRFYALFFESQARIVAIKLLSEYSAPR
jgi:hypothetical protein